MGLLFPHVGKVFSEPQGGEVGFAAEMCTRLDNDNYWRCEGTLMDMYDCEGQMSFSGVYEDKKLSGKYVITGGTGAYLGATGYIYDEYNDHTGFSVKTVHLE